MPIVSVNDNSLYYRVDPFSMADKSFQLAVIFIHGSGCSAQRWNNQFPVHRVLAPHTEFKIQFLALDLPAHARSQGNSCQTIEEFCTVISEFVDALGLSKVILVGNSLGGAIALQSALNPAPWLKGIVLVGSGAKLRVTPVILDDLAKDIFPRSLTQMSYATATQQKIIDAAEQDLLLTPNSIRLKDLQACDAFDISTQTNQITLPALIIVGEEDNLTPVKYAKYLKNNLPDSQLAIIPQAGHMVMLEQPDLFNQALAKFLLALY